MHTRYSTLLTRGRIYRTRGTATTGTETDYWRCWLKYTARAVKGVLLLGGPHGDGYTFTHYLQSVKKGNHGVSASPPVCYRAQGWRHLI